MTDLYIPDWIKPGADIVIYQASHGLSDHAPYHVTKVKRVAAQSFTVEAIDDRFRFATLSTKDFGSSYRPWRWRAVQRHGEKHHELRMRRIKAQTRTAAINAVEKWGTNRDDIAQVDAVIEAMRTLRAALEFPAAESAHRGPPQSPD